MILHFTFSLGWNCVISVKIQMPFQVLLLQKQAILRPLLFLLYYMQNRLTFKVGSLCPASRKSSRLRRKTREPTKK